MEDLPHCIVQGTILGENMWKILTFKPLKLKSISLDKLPSWIGSSLISLLWLISKEVSVVMLQTPLGSFSSLLFLRFRNCRVAPSMLSGKVVNELPWISKMFKEGDQWSTFGIFWMELKETFKFLSTGKVSRDGGISFKRFLCKSSLTRLTKQSIFKGKQDNSFQPRYNLR